MAPRKKGQKPGAVLPGIGDDLDRVIDESLRKGKPVSGVMDRPSSRSRGAGRAMKLHPESGDPIGVEAEDLAESPPEAPAARPSDGFPHAHVEAAAAMGESVPVAAQPGESPGQRVANVRARHPEYSEEFELRVLSRMLQRNIPIDQIAAALQCSVRTVYNKRNRLYAAMRDLSSNFDMNEHVGEGASFYLEGRGKALQMLDQPNQKPHIRLQALSEARAYMNDYVRFLSVTGVYAAKPYRPEADADSRREKGDFIFQLERAVFKGLDHVDALFDAQDAEDKPASRDSKLRVY